jgi:Coenzyme PQQ synthesis protein D (PqqD)
VRGYARPAHVGEVVQDWDDAHVVVYLAPLPDGPVQVLNGVGSLIWLEATATDASDDVVDRVAALVERPPDTIRAEVDVFLARLVEAGLLEQLNG